MGKGQKVFTSLVVFLFVIVSGCTSFTTPTVRSAGDVAISFPFEANPGTEIEVTIQGDDMDSPILAEIGLQDGVAEGTIGDVDAGMAREMVVTAYGPAGQICTASLTVDVMPNELTIVDQLTLFCPMDEDETVTSDAPESSATIASIDW